MRASIHKEEVSICSGLILIEGVLQTPWSVLFEPALGRIRESTFRFYRRGTVQLGADPSEPTFSFLDGENRRIYSIMG